MCEYNGCRDKEKEIYTFTTSVHDVRSAQLRSDYRLSFSRGGVLSIYIYIVDEHSTRRHLTRNWDTGKNGSTFSTKYETKQRFCVGHTFTSCTSGHPLKLTANRTPHRILMCCPSKQTLALVLLAGSKRSRRPTSLMTTRTRTPHPVTCAIGVSRTACIYMSFDETFERGTKVYRFLAKTLSDGAPASTSLNPKPSEFQQFFGGVFCWSSGWLRALHFSKFSSVFAP